jgi:DNA-binding response OmpR family regulator
MVAALKGRAEPMRVLVVDDEWEIRDLVQTTLEGEGFNVRSAANGEDGLRSFYAWNPSAVILDIRMPGMDGMKVLERIRQTSETPVIMLTALGDEPDKVKGLRRGADDYLVKPVLLNELCARVEAVLRRAKGAPAPQQPAVYADAVLRVDYSRHQVYLRGDPVDLSPQEFRVLSALIAQPGVVLSTDRLLDLCWGEGEGGPESVRVYIGYLRKKLEQDPRAPRLVETVREFGYRYRPPSEG